MPRRDGPENLGILKRSLVDFLLLNCMAGFFQIWKQIILFGSWPAEMNWDLKHHKMCRVLGGGVSIDFYDLYLSPHVAKDWNQKLINPFVSKMTESACICIHIIIDIIMVIHVKLAYMAELLSINHCWESKTMSKGLFFCLNFINDNFRLTFFFKCHSKIFQNYIKEFCKTVNVQDEKS